MNIDLIPTGDNPPENINVVIEVPIGGEPVKYEFDKKSGALFVDRILHTPMRYPANYGFVPHTLSPDGDPLDALVIARSPFIPGCVVRARPIAVLKLEDEAGGDECAWRIRRSFPTAVSTASGSKGVSQPPVRYPRFGVHFTMHGGRGPAKAALSSHASSWSGACSMLLLHGVAEKVALYETRRTRVPMVSSATSLLPLHTPVQHFARNFIRTDFARNYLMQKAYEVSGYAPHWWLTPAGTAWSSAAMTQRNNHSQPAIAKPQGQAIVSAAAARIT